MTGLPAHPGTARSRSAAPPRSSFQPELQALRALAVTVVVVYHLWPGYLPGGYIGVDVFFAISGYLMTKHIVAGVTGGRGFTLAAFYTRRIRRLLPASLFVLSVVAVLTLVFASPISWIDSGVHIVASALYVENWALLINSVDYLGAGTATIPTQHFWSLSVEEQFYLVWPILLIAAWALARRLRPARPSQAVIVGVIAVVGVASFIYSVLATAFDQPSAYFNTLTRMWEFAAGGALALALPRLRIPGRVAIALTWVGLAVIVTATLVYTDQSPFPGSIALVPIIATLAVIAGGDVPGRMSLASVIRSRPVQFLGDISYSVYLWHWPLIVLLPAIIDRPSNGTIKIAILVLSVALAWLSKRYIEDPFRADGGLRRRAVPRPRRAGVVFGAAAAGMVVVSLVGGSAWAVAQTRVAAADASLASLGPLSTMPCFGAADLAGDCVGATTTGNAVYPDPLIARENTGSAGCQQSSGSSDILSCSFGSTAPGSLRVALAGDSHAGQWLSAMKGAANLGGWSLATYLRSGCGIAVAAERGIGGQARCADWNTAVIQKIIEERYDVVVVSLRSSKVGGGSFTSGELTSSAAAISRAWKRFADAGIRVVAIRDTPQPVSAGIFDLPSCVETAGPAALAECTISQDTALVPDAQVEASALVKVPVVDMTDRFCRDGKCPPIIGHALVYSDGHHMTAVYSQTLAPYLAERIETALLG
ncbi:MAG: acyltransferase [Burkholderiaceae bacterium]|nr:acyltransferase [Microbacteriaceae bacterium]